MRIASLGSYTRKTLIALSENLCLRAGKKKEMGGPPKRTGPVGGSSSAPHAGQLPVSTGWFELHQVLYHALPQGVVELGRGFAGFEETADGEPGDPLAVAKQTSCSILRGWPSPSRGNDVCLRLKALRNS